MSIPSNFTNSFVSKKISSVALFKAGVVEAFQITIRYASSTSINGLTTRELRTFRTLYSSRELLSNLNASANHDQTESVKSVTSSRALRTLYIPASLAGWNGSNAKVQSTATALITKTVNAPAVSSEAQKLISYIDQYNSKIDGASKPQFKLEVLRLSQRQLRRLTAGSHLTTLRNLLQGGVFQLTLKVDWGHSVSNAVETAAINDLLRFVAIQQFTPIRLTQTSKQQNIPGSLPIRAILLTPTAATTTTVHHSSLWRVNSASIINGAVRSYANQLASTTNLQSFNPTQAFACALSTSVAQRSIPATNVVGFLKSSGASAICRTLQTISKGSSVSGSPIGSRLGQLGYVRLNLLHLVNFVGRKSA